MTFTDTRANVIHEDVGPQERETNVVDDPRALSLWWLAAYLSLSGIVLAVKGHGGTAALHAAGVAVAAGSMAPGSPVRGRVGDLLPLFVAPVLYGEIPWLIAALGTTYHDSLVQQWEWAVFGTQPSRTLAGAIPLRGLSELLHAGYLAYYPAIFAPPLWFYFKGARRAFAETVLTLTVIYTLSWVLFVLMPVEGPRFLWSGPVGVPEGPVRRLALSVLAAGSSRGAAFPSSHMAVMIGQTILAFRFQPRVGLVLSVISVLVGVGAVYGGFHYGVDMVAGAAVGGVCAWLVVRRMRE
jgi:membrane-associated phospholipid phosphatase